jgi:hypothetical protein
MQLRRYSDGVRAERPEFDFRRGKEIFLYSTAPRPATGPIQPHIQQIKGTLRNLVSTVGIAYAYGLDDRGVGVRVLVGSRIFSSPRRPDRL